MVLLCPLWICLTAAVPLTAVTCAQEEEVRKALQGEWKAVRGGVAFRVQIGEAFSFNAKGPNVDLSGDGFGYEVKKEGTQLVMELDRRSAEVAGIPNRIPFRFDRGTLRLTMADGLLGGAWQLERVPPKDPRDLNR